MVEYQIRKPDFSFAEKPETENEIEQKLQTDTKTEKPI